WTTLVQVPCQRSARPGARPLWRVVSRPGRQGTRAAGHADKGPPPAEGADRWGQVPKCRYGRWGVRSHDFQGETTYNGTTGAGQTPPHSMMSPPRARAGSPAPVPTRW